MPSAPASPPSPSSRSARSRTWWRRPGRPGLVIVNPPYGDRIGEKGRVKSLYRALGQTLLTRFAGWRVGLITSEDALAKATGLPFTLTAAPVLHGGLRVTLFRTAPLP